MPKTGSTQRSRRGLVLIVEDHPDTRSAVAEHLQEQGWDVAVAADGDTALLLARARRPDLVYLDLNLPKASGFEICEVIRADPILKDVVILMTSARGTVDVHAYSIEAGANAYLAKPYGLDRLTEMLDDLIQAAPPTSDPR